MDIIIEKHVLESDKINKSIKIALLTDLHIIDETPQTFNDSIIGAVKKVSPDYICLVGDYFCGHGKYNFNSPLSKKLINSLLHELGKIAPVILSLGNHDLTIPKEEELRKAFRALKGKNIYPLDNESTEFSNINFSGFYPRRKSYAIAKISSKKVRMIIDDWHQANLTSHKDKLSILCHHIPDTVLDKRIQQEAKSLYNYDLILSGHAHNGWLSPKQEERREQKINKKISKIVNNEEKLKRLEAKKYHGFCESFYSMPPFIRKISRGKHEVNGTNMIISKGITSGLKFAIGNKFMIGIFTGFSYVTEIEIKPKSNI
jgi:predicted MPP superfamily phosphohydrolase